MKLAIMQPYIFPYIGYFQVINAVDQYVIYDDVQFIKGGWINRNNLLVGGQKNMFTFPLAEASPNKAINEIELIGDFGRFEKTIALAYKKAPFFNSTYELIRGICSYADKNLAGFVGNSIIKIAEYLGCSTKFIYSSNLRKDENLKSQDKVIAICKQLQADIYINSIGGTELYSKEEFRDQGLELQFLKPNLEEYKQFKNEFIPGLSIIDVLMFNSPEKARQMLLNYELR